VRGGPFKDLQILYPKPKCKFGKFDMVVDATYVLCTTSPTAIEEREAHHRDKVKIKRGVPQAYMICGQVCLPIRLLFEIFKYLI
jgi:DsbC/DsbD-like thiol-disulfide interchange protein